MTTNESLAQPLIDMLNTDAMIDSDVDVYALIATLQPIVPGPVFEMIALAHDMCPIHLTDLDTCRDDDTLNVTNSIVLDTPPLSACRHLR